MLNGMPASQLGDPCRQVLKYALRLTSGLGRYPGLAETFEPKAVIHGGQHFLHGHIQVFDILATETNHFHGKSLRSGHIRIFVCGIASL
jgi:hypothetical protein